MKLELGLVEKFHKKFRVPVAKNPSLIKNDRSRLRHWLMKEEVEEYKKGVQDRDMANIAKELADILYATYGTILEHGLQDKMERIFKEVHRANMSKTYHRHKMVKGKAYSEPDMRKVLKNT